MRSIKVDGQKLRHHRELLGLTQEDLAGELGYSDRLIRKAESGGPVARSTLQKLVLYFQEKNSTSDGDSIERELSFAALEVNTDSDLEERIRRWFDSVFNRRDLSVIDELIHPHAEFFSESSTVWGREGVRQRVLELLAAFASINVTIEQVHLSGLTVVCFLRIKKKHTGKYLGVEPTHQAVTVRGSSMTRFEDGKIREARDHWDPHGLMSSLRQSTKQRHCRN